jgi:hypothetical protein
MSYTNNSRYKLGICELWWKYKHGSDSTNYENKINGHFIFMQNVQLIHFYNYYKKYILKLLRCYDEHLTQSFINVNTYDIEALNHKIIRNFNNIISMPNYYELEIIDIDYVDDTTVAIKKTFWLKIIQRIWKRIYKKRMEIIKKRCNINSIHYRQIHGKWPPECNYLPSIYY